MEQNNARKILNALADMYPNAAPALKAAATGVIAPNTEDGVAHWLEEHALGRAALHNPVKTVYNLRKNV